MSDTVSPATVQPATDADGKLLLSAEEARALLRECCAQFQSGLVEVLAGSLESTNDLFEQNKFVSDAEILDFRGKRGEWLNRFAQTYKELFERRLDDLLWSITAKERNAQKTKLTKMVPALIRDLRAGGAAVQVREERLQPFLEAVYKLHMAAIKPKPKSTPVAAVANLAPTAPQAPQEEPARLPPLDNVHDFVGEMVVGTWVAFNRDQGASNARLSWVSPMRTKYIFTTRSRGQALVVSPEELAWQLSEGTARLIVEPVPLFDRAVSSAIDGLARDKPGAEAA
jgi:hypothetical protein